MSYNINFQAVATALSHLTIPGVNTILDLDELKANAKNQPDPILIPHPKGFITNFSLSDRTFGTNGSETWTVKYNVNYRYLHAPIGARLDFGEYQNMINNISVILGTLMTDDTLANAADDVTVKTVETIGGVVDPAGLLHHGCDIVLQIVQYSE